MFEQTEICFLQVGHMNEEIGKTFFKIYCFLKSEISITLSDFSGGLQKTFEGRSEVTYLDRVVRWLGFC